MQFHIVQSVGVKKPRAYYGATQPHITSISITKNCNFVFILTWQIPIVLVNRYKPLIGQHILLQVSFST